MRGGGGGWGAKKTETKHNGTVSGCIGIFSSGGGFCVYTEPPAIIIWGVGTWECVGWAVGRSSAHLEPTSSFPPLYLFLFLLPLLSPSLTQSWDPYVAQEVAKRPRVRCWSNRSWDRVWRSFKLRPFSIAISFFIVAHSAALLKSWKYLYILLHT